MRITAFIKEMLVEEIEMNKLVLFGTFQSVAGAQKKQRTWERVRDRLNTLIPDQSEHRSVAEWKKTWSDMKRLAKQKSTKIKNHRIVTGGGSPIDDELTDMDARIISTTEIAAHGHSAPQTNPTIVLSHQPPIPTSPVAGPSNYRRNRGPPSLTSTTTSSTNNPNDINQSASPTSPVGGLPNYRRNRGPPSLTSTTTSSTNNPNDINQSASPTSPVGGLPNYNRNRSQLSSATTTPIRSQYQGQINQNNDVIPDAVLNSGESDIASPRFVELNQPFGTSLYSSAGASFAASSNTQPAGSQIDQQVQNDDNNEEAGNISGNDSNDDVINEEIRRRPRGLRSRIPNTLRENSRVCLETQQRGYVTLCEIQRQQEIFVQNQNEQIQNQHVIIQNQNRQIESQDRLTNILEQFLNNLVNQNNR